MRLTYTWPVVLAFALFFVETKPNSTASVNIIEKMTQDLQTSPSGYTFHRRSDSVHPGGYEADVNHGGAKVTGHVGMEKLVEMNILPGAHEGDGKHGQSGTYRVAGGYGFVISHDYGSRTSHTDTPGDDTHSGASNADVESLAVLQLDSEHCLTAPSIDVGEESEYDGARQTEGLAGYIEKDGQGSYMEYDQLVEVGKKEPSVNPAGEYYGSDVYGGKEKYDLDAGYGESNIGRDTGRYVESEKYYGPRDYNGNGNYVAPADHADSGANDQETEKYLELGEYTAAFDNGNEGAELHDYGYPYNEKHEAYQSFKTNHDSEDYAAPFDRMESSSYSMDPRFEEMRDSFLKDFLKEYNNFAHGEGLEQAHDQYDSGFGYHDEDFYDHDAEDESSLYAEDGESGKRFFDDADSHGEHHEEAAGEKAGNFGEKKGHKKGSKTTGYRNVLHKDEYTKDHTFYANADNGGHFDNDADYRGHHHQDDGSHEQGHHDHSHLTGDHTGEAHNGDRGHDYHDDLSHHEEFGYKSYFDDNYDHSHGGESLHGTEYGESYDSGSDP